MSLLFEGLIVHSLKTNIQGKKLPWKIKYLSLYIILDIKKKKKAEGKALGAQINIIVSKYFRTY